MKNVNEFLEENYPESKVADMIDQEIMEWVDRDDSDYNGDDYEWYQEYCNGEAEDVVRNEISKDVLKHFPEFDDDLDTKLRELYYQLDK